MQITTVLFDFDGTLFDSLKITYKATCAVFEDRGMPAPTFTDYQSHCHPPFVPYYHDRGVDLTSDQIWENFLRLANFENGELFADVHTVLNKCVSEGIFLGLISSQRNNILQRCCDKHLISDFFNGAIIGDAIDKAPVISKFCQDERLLPEHTIYVGDSTADMHCSVKANVRGVGITRGHLTRKKLQEAGASHCIDHLDELLDLILK